MLFQKRLILSLAAASLPSLLSAKCPDFPGATWTEAPEKISQSKAKSFHQKWFPKRTAYGKARKGVRTDALVIIKDGCLVFEDYAKEFKPSSKFLAWSVTKSVSAMLIGIAERKGLLSRDDLVTKYIPSKNFEGLKVKDILYWSSGLAWQETYEFAPLYSDVVAMLYTVGRGDMTAYMKSLPRAYPPGKKLTYSTGDSNLLMAILRGAIDSDEAYNEFPWKELFDPLGIQSATFEQDAAGTFAGGSYFYASPRDLAKLGLLMLKKGKWKQKQLLPKDWLEFSSQPNPNYKNEKQHAYPGVHWWLNAPKGQKPVWPDAPKDMLAGSGHWGQYLFILPSQNMIVARFGDERDKSFKHNDFIRESIELVEAVELAK